VFLAVWSRANAVSHHALGILDRHNEKLKVANAMLKCNSNALNDQSHNTVEESIKQMK
jgi:hypothetical protein